MARMCTRCGTVLINDYSDKYCPINGCNGEVAEIDDPDVYRTLLSVLRSYGNPMHMVIKLSNGCDCNGYKIDTRLKHFPIHLLSQMTEISGLEDINVYELRISNTIHGITEFCKYDLESYDVGRFVGTFFVNKMIDLDESGHVPIKYIAHIPPDEVYKA